MATSLRIRVWMFGAIVGLMVIPSLTPTAAQQQTAGGDSSIQLRWASRDGKVESSFVALRGLSADQLQALSRANATADDWTRVFTVSVINEAATKTSPLFGAYSIEDGTVVFRPRFPLSAGLRYRATFDPWALKIPALADVKPVSADLAIPKREPTAKTILEHVYPALAQLPENQLKLYLHFSAPMSRGEAYERVHLLDAAGKEIDIPFLELGEELWNPEGTRLTLLFDPGRIKRGLRPREEDGPILEEGKSYTLVIDRDWLDAQGNPLKVSFRRQFSAGPPDDVQPDPKTWQITPPAAGTRSPLTVVSPEPLDHALFERQLTVMRGDRPVPGDVSVSEQDKKWQFTPQGSWEPGDYRLQIETTLEDLAGNSVGRPFEVDLIETVTRNVVGETVDLPFTVK